MDLVDDWEDGPLPPLLSKEQPKNSWDDKDVEVNEVKQSWEDEDDNTQAPVSKPAVGKSTKKPVSKASEMKGKFADITKEAPLYLIGEELCQQRLVGDLSTDGTNEKSLDNFIPKSESDFLKYAELISHKLRPYEHSYFYLGLLKAVMRISMKTQSFRCKRSSLLCLQRLLMREKLMVATGKLQPRKRRRFSWRNQRIKPVWMLMMLVMIMMILCEFLDELVSLVHCCG